MNFKQDAIYLQIAEYVNDNIILGKWLPDEKIPSVRELAETMQVNPNTVTRGYDHLQAVGIIANRRGLGMFVTANAIEQIKQQRRERFYEQDVPDFFTNLYLLDIDAAEIMQRYDDFIGKINAKNSKNENK